MSDWFWKKLDALCFYGALAFLFFIAIFQANIEIKDLDLWLHLGVGRYILANFTIPHVDVFSCTVAGTPWINHEWLFQIFAYTLYQTGGMESIVFLQVALVAVTLGLLTFWGMQSERRTGLLVCLLLVLLNYSIRFTHRPDLFSLFFVVLFVYILSSGLKSRLAPVFIFLLQIIWVNMHGFFILGPLLIAVSLFSQWCKIKFKLPFEWNKSGLLDRDDHNQLIILLIVSVMACFMNPYLFKGILYPFKVLFSVGGESKVFFGYIVELSQPILWSNIFSLEFLPFKLLIALSFLSLAFNYRKLDLSALLLWIIFLILALKAVRNLPYFSFIAFFVFISNIQHFTPDQFFNKDLIKRKLHYVFSILIKVILCWWMFQYYSGISMAGYFDFEKYERKSEYQGVTLRNYPTKAVDFLVNNRVEGNFLNHFNTGSYLVGRTSPAIKVFIDGRTEVYGSEFFSHYRNIWMGDYDLLKEAVEKFEITGVILNSIRVPASQNIIKGLYKDENWRLVYFGYDAQIFLKKDPVNKKVIASHDIDLKSWEAPKLDMEQLKLKNASPFRNIRMAYALFNLGFLKKAEREAEYSLLIDPSVAKGWNLLAKIDMERGNFEEAYLKLRKAKVSDVNDVEVRYNLGVCLYSLKRLDEAEEQANRVLMKDPANAKTHYLLSRIYIIRGDFEKAYEALEVAVTHGKYHKKELNKVLALLKDNKQEVLIEKIQSKID